jgi:hypothetical protein
MSTSSASQQRSATMAATIVTPNEQQGELKTSLRQNG